MCSNVTGNYINYAEVINCVNSARSAKNLLQKLQLKSKILLAFDMAQAAPYIFLDKSQSDSIDAMFISTHKYFGGPGSSGILIISQQLLCNRIPTTPGGGTVFWVDGTQHV